MLKGKGFAAEDNLKISLNDREIKSKSKQGLELVTFVLHIKGGTEITFWEPVNDIELTPPSDISVNKSFLAVDKSGTYWSSNENESGKYLDGHKAANGEEYYLNCRLTYNDDGENTIIFGNTVKINGITYPVKKFGFDYIRVLTQLPTRNLYAKVTEDADGVTYIDVPKSMTVAVVAALYNSDGTVKNTMVKSDVTLSAGKNQVSLSDIGDAWTYFVMRNKSETVKIFVVDKLQHLKPLSSIYNYKYIYR